MNINLSKNGYEIHGQRIDYDGENICEIEVKLKF